MALTNIRAFYKGLCTWHREHALSGIGKINMLGSGGHDQGHLGEDDSGNLLISTGPQLLHSQEHRLRGRI